MADGPPMRFPRWRVFRRSWSATEAALARLPMLVLVPTAGAIVGSAWGVSHPFQTIRRGLVVGQASFGRVLVSALVGGVVGLLALIGLVWVCIWAWYRLRGDAAWEVGWSLYSKEPRPGILSTASTVILRCTGVPPVSVSALGHVEAVIRLPSGDFRRMPQHGMGSDEHTLTFSATGGGGAPPPGKYEVRWYGTTAGRKRYEIARSRYVVPDGVEVG